MCRRLYQLTWLSPKTWSYAVGDFDADVRQAATPLKDGWGITSDGGHLIVGDSSERLTWVDPDHSMAAVRSVAVTGGWRGVAGGGCGAGLHGWLWMLAGCGLRVGCRCWRAVCSDLRGWIPREACRLALSGCQGP